MKKSLLLFTVGLAVGNACTQPHHQAGHFHKIVIVGNSITYSAPYSKVGWTGHWGMAASAPDKDFVHILTRRFRQETPGAKVSFQNIAEWEHSYWKYKLARFDTIRQSNPDLLIVRIGENVNGDSLAQHQFSQHLDGLVTALKGPGTRVVLVSAFWDGNPSIEAMRRYAQTHDFTYIPLAQLGNVPDNKATGQHADKGVASHPSDKGMLAIANAIWEGI